MHDWTAETYKLFRHNCRHYSKELLNRLDPDNASNAREYLRKLFRDQDEKEPYVRGINDFIKKKSDHGHQD